MNDLMHDLNLLIEALSPDTLLWVGQPVDEQALPSTSDTQLTHINTATSLNTLDGLGRYDVAVVFLSLEALSRQHGEQLLGRLKNVHSQRLMIVTNAQTWSPAQFYAFGLTQLNEYDVSEGTLSLYEYNIHSYKSVPDWLNNKFWANPTMWNKYRW